MNARSLLVCLAPLLFASLAYGGSYQRTRDGQTLVWRDVPARGDEATWSGKRDKDGFATGSGVLTWYKVEPTIVTGSNILDTRRYVMMVSHYSGTMVRGKFKGGVNYVEGNGKRSEQSSVKETNRQSHRLKAARTPTSHEKSTPNSESSPTPFSEPITVENPERTSALATTTPAPQSQPAVPQATVATAAKPIATAPELAPEQSRSPNAEESQPAVAQETVAAAANPTATTPELAPDQHSSVVGQEQQTQAPPQTGPLIAKQMAIPPEKHSTQPDAQALIAPKATHSGDSQESLPEGPSELPKPPRKIDAETVARLDAVYQSAVKANDVAIMDEILADDFVLITDRGASLTKADLIKEAQGKRTIYEHQEVEEGTQKVRIWRDTAVVTALLIVKGTRDENPFDYKVWVSETYVRTPTGWRYVFGQPLKPDEK